MAVPPVTGNLVEHNISGGLGTLLGWAGQPGWTRDSPVQPSARRRCCRKIPHIRPLLLLLQGGACFTPPFNPSTGTRRGFFQHGRWSSPYS